MAGWLRGICDSDSYSFFSIYIPPTLWHWHTLAYNTWHNDCPLRKNVLDWAHSRYIPGVYRNTTKMHCCRSNLYTTLSISVSGFYTYTKARCQCRVWGGHPTLSQVPRNFIGLRFTQAILISGGAESRGIYNNLPPLVGVHFSDYKALASPATATSCAPNIRGCV